MLFLVNPKKRRRRSSARRSTSRRRTRRTHKRKRAMPAALKAYWASKRGGKTMERRKRRRGRRRHVAARRNPVRSHRRRVHRGRRSYRRNPGFSGGSIVRSVTEGLKCGSFVVLGEAVSVTVPDLVRLPTHGLMGAGVIGLTGTVLGMVGRRFLGANVGYFVAGAWAKAIKVAIAPYAASIPLIGAGLTGYTPALPGRARAALSGYAPRGGGGVGVSAADDGSGYIF